MPLTFITNREPGSSYNIDDLNRVEQNVFDISELLKTYGYPANIESVKTDWKTTDFPKAIIMQRYIDNVNMIMDSFYSMAPLPPVSMNNINYADANDIEKTLESVYTLIENMEKEFKYSGEFYSGDDVLI